MGVSFLCSALRALEGFRALLLFLRDRMKVLDPTVIITVSRLNFEN